MDKYDEESLNHKDHDFAWDFLGGNRAKEEAHSTILDLTRWEHKNASQVDLTSHMLMRYRLIDIIANVLDCEKHPNLHSFPPKEHPVLPPRVERVSLLFS
jgi:hypothetical protein